MTHNLPRPIRNGLSTARNWLLGCALTLAAPWGLAGAATTAGLQLQARLFHSATGRFSADVLAAGAPDLVNVVAGDDPSVATLVVVVVQLAPGTVLRSDTPVRLTVRDQAPRGGGQRVVLDRRQALGALPQGGTAHLAFWLQGTGCRPLQLLARMTVAGHAAPLSATASVPFACGE